MHNTKPSASRNAGFTRVCRSFGTKSSLTGAAARVGLSAFNTVVNVYAPAANYGCNILGYDTSSKISAVFV
jgi:hypothetical protein